jgi:hypothetical protein
LKQNVRVAEKPPRSRSSLQQANQFTAENVSQNITPDLKKPALKAAVLGNRRGHDEEITAKQERRKNKQVSSKSSLMHLKIINETPCLWDYHVRTC